MQAAVPQSLPRGIWRILGPRRVIFTLLACALGGLLVSPIWVIPALEVMARAMLVGLVALVVFGVFEQWPAQLPGWIARWVLQVVAVVVAIPTAVLALYLAITVGDELPFWRSEARLSGFFVLSITGVLLASWMAMSALLRQRDEAARNQALAFKLERSELERKAIDARLRLLQAQVEPHFLFNTLANVRELVDSGSPQASHVLDTLITYLRAAVPRLHDTTTTLGQELQLVHAYLELMQLRMPDRLQFSLAADDGTAALRCPPTTLLTLVENAIRHGIDPGEEGGRIDVRVRLRNGRCEAEVTDTGVGVRETAAGLGTGLSTLRERLQLEFGADAQVRLAPLQPHGAVATADFPARPITP
jgi:histidine kinase/histidine kinase/DNA gyrase B/HSP90-like ATPase